MTKQNIVTGWIRIIAGLVMQIVYSLIRFEPRNLNHRSVMEVTRELIGQS